MSTGSTVPAALDALAQALDSISVEVYDGQVYDDQGEDFFAVGWDRSDNDAVQATRQSTAAAFGPGYERFDVSCLIAVSDGSGTPSSVRATAYDVYGEVVAILSADPTLAGVVDSAEVTEHNYTPQQIDTGAACDVRLVISVTAFVTG